MTDSRLWAAMDKPDMVGFVVLAKSKTDNSYKAIIERSWSMDLSSDCCLFFWTGKGYSALFKPGAYVEIDGFKDATHHKEKFGQNNAGMDFTIFEVHATDLPIAIDWDTWRKDCAPSEKTLSGVQNKFGARNPRFVMKEE